MRSDMAKVLTERPRSRSLLTYGDFRQRENGGDADLLPTRQGMRRPYIRRHGRCKEFSDLLNPLIRFLHGNVGRPWADVWSDVCHHADASSVTGRHLREHILLEVETRTRLIDGEVCEFLGSRHWKVTGLYVHPVDGTLRDGGRLPRSHWYSGCVILDGIRYRREDSLLVPQGGGIPRKIIVHGKQEAACFGGVWYWVDFGVVPTLPRLPGGNAGLLARHRMPVDIVTGKAIREGIYRCGKRQMNRRSLVRHGLVNAAA